MTTLFFNPGNDPLGEQLAARLPVQRGQLSLRHFPDGESYVRVLDDVAGRHCVIHQTLFQPDSQVLPLLLLVDTLRDLGARSVGLVAPYLAYMRQDIRFQPGEGITSRYFARLLSRYVDWLVTVDPHLHRYASLDEIYTIPSHVVAAMPTVARWIQGNVTRPLLVGPDSESEQWTAHAARMVDCPWLVLEKTRLGDRDVRIEVPRGTGYTDHTPVLIDDIISSGQTMLTTAEGLVNAGLAAPVCIGVHAVMDTEAWQRLTSGHIQRVVTCNTIPHASNILDVSEPLAEAVLPWLAG